MRLKFMGSADVKELLKGDTFSDVLSEGLPVTLAFTRANGWTIDTDDEQYADVPDEVWEYLILNDAFVDVTDYKRPPLNEHQKIFMGLREGEQKTQAELEEARQAALDAAFENARNAAAAANAREEVLEKIRDGGATRTELLTLAKEHNVKGRSNMSVEELQEALTDVVRNSVSTTAEVTQDAPVHTGSTVSGGTTTSGGSTGGTTTVGGSTKKS